MGYCSLILDVSKLQRYHLPRGIICLRLCAAFSYFKIIFCSYRFSLLQANALTKICPSLPLLYSSVSNMRVVLSVV